MSSLFDVPVQLVMVLSLAASAAGTDAPPPNPSPEITAPASQTVAVAEPLAGPFRFSERQWLRALKESAPTGAAAGYAGRIFKTSSGRYYVPAATERGEILDARWDVDVASRVARAFAELNARRMRPALKRVPTPGDLYLAHVFGPEAAAAFIKLAQAKPGDLAAEHFKELLETAPEALFDGAEPVTVGVLYGRLTNPLRERRTPMDVTSAADEDGGSESVSLALKPSLLGAEPRNDVSRSVAVAWRSEIKDARTIAPVQ